MEVWFRWFSFSTGWLLGSILIFRSVLWGSFFKFVIHPENIWELFICKSSIGIKYQESWQWERERNTNIKKFKHLDLHSMMERVTILFEPPTPSTPTSTHLQNHHHQAFQVPKMEESENLYKLHIRWVSKPSILGYLNWTCWWPFCVQPPGLVESNFERRTGHWREGLRGAARVLFFGGAS